MLAIITVIAIDLFREKRVEFYDQTGGNSKNYRIMKYSK